MPIYIYNNTMQHKALQYTAFLLTKLEWWSSSLIFLVGCSIVYNTGLLYCLVLPLQ